MANAREEDAKKEEKFRGTSLKTIGMRHLSHRFPVRKGLNQNNHQDNHQVLSFQLELSLRICDSR